MPSPSDSRDAARKRAQNHFTASEQRDVAVKQEIEKERAAVAAKTAKLRALRLAKEATDKIEADRVAAEAPPAKAKRSRAKAVKAKA
ncbi:MAG TPA: hypothetical protein VN932_10035 [Rhizomicrobium sp.]|nr:hypothetical protein [Rhizomicrobium sp.]